MQARIYKPTKTSMQSGNARNCEWLLNFIHTGSRKLEPIMGWTSSNDTMQEVKLRFPSKQSAINFAISNGYNYEIIEPQVPKFIKRSYTDNFK